MNAETVDNAGTPQLRQLNTVNIEMFRHPNYYKELRKLRNKLDQAISEDASTEATSVRPGPGPKQPGSGSSNKQQAKKAQATKSQAS